jgi:flagellar motor switch protein FliG
MTADAINLRNAALLVASLDRRVADELLAQMSPAQARRVRQAVVELGEVSADDQEDLLEEFAESRRTHARRVTGGLDLELVSTKRLLAGDRKHHREDELMLSGAADERAGTALRANERGPTGDAEASTQEPQQPFRFLHEARIDDLAQRLAREQPTTIAVVLSHLPAEQAAQALAELPEHAQVDVLRRLASGAQPEPWLVREIEESMRSWIAPGGESATAANGLALAKSIVTASSAANRRRLLSTMSDRDGDLLHRLTGERKREHAPTAEREPIAKARAIAQSMPGSAPQITFAKVESLADARLAALWMSAEPQVGLLALAGAPPALVDRVLGALPNSAAASICRQLDDLGPVALADLDRAQHEMAMAAEQLDETLAASAASTPPARRVAI